MTAMAERPLDQPVATVPWPYVERRRTSRTAAPAGTDMTATPALVPTQRALGDPACAPASAAGRRGRWSGGWSGGVVLAAVLSDAGAALLAALLAYGLRFGDASGGAPYLGGLLVAPPVWVAAVALARGYEQRWFGSGAEEFRCVLRAAVLVAAGSATVSYAMHAELARGYLLAACVLVAVGTLAGRLACRAGLRAARRRGRALPQVVVVGHETAVVDLVRQVVRADSDGLRIVGACVPGATSPALTTLGVTVLGDLHDVPEVVRRGAVDTVAVAACAEMSGPALRRLAWGLEGTGVDLVVSPGLVEVAGPRLHIRPLCGLPLLHVEEPELSGSRHLVKALLDRSVALGALVLLSPLLVSVALLVGVTTPGPVMFCQQRVGKDGRVFCMWKFRTMHVDAEQRLDELLDEGDPAGERVLFKLRQDPRVTAVGRRLRRWSLDELPQLLNVLRGQMSLVGPRPPLPREVARYGDGVHRRLLVKPGLTGLWQIGGRSELSWDESIRLDLRYVENWSLALDLMILCKTFAAVVRGRGAY